MLISYLIRVKAATAAPVYTRRCGTKHSDHPGPWPIASANQLMTGPPTLRFAVAAFDTSAEVQKALHSLSAGGKALNDVSYLGLGRVLADKKGEIPQTVRTLVFPGNVHPIACTAGPVADRLAGRLEVGAATLDTALSRWLIARHAAHLQKAVEDGKILLWVQLFDNDDERRAYQSLLATSASSVGVHDLVGA